MFSSNSQEESELGNLHKLYIIPLKAVLVVFHSNISEILKVMCQTVLSFPSPTGYLSVFRGALVSAEPGERPGRSSLGHHAGLAPCSLLRLPTSHLGHLRPCHHPGNPAAGYTRTNSSFSSDNIARF